MSKLTDVLKTAGFVGHHSVGTIFQIKRSMRAHDLEWAASALCDLQTNSGMDPGARISVTVLSEEDREAGKRHPKTSRFVLAIEDDELAIHPASELFRTRDSTEAVYGRISRMFNGLVGGTSPQTIVCKDSEGLREVCVFNRDGGVWSDANEVELQTVLKALQNAS